MQTLQKPQILYPFSWSVVESTPRYQPPRKMKVTIDATYLALEMPNLESRQHAASLLAVSNVFKRIRGIAAGNVEEDVGTTADSGSQPRAAWGEFDAVHADSTHGCWSKNLATSYTFPCIAMYNVPSLLWLASSFSVNTFGIVREDLFDETGREISIIDTCELKKTALKLKGASFPLIITCRARPAGLRRPPSFHHPLSNSES